MNFSDYMNYNLIKKGYSNMEEIPITEIINTATNFLASKLHFNEPNPDINTLFIEFSMKKSTNPEEIVMIIYYLLDYISILQHYEIIWEIADVKEPIFTYSKQYPSQIDSLITSKIWDYQKVFALVLNTCIDLKEQREQGLSK